MLLAGRERRGFSLHAAPRSAWKTGAGRFWKAKMVKTVLIVLLILLLLGVLPLWPYSAGWGLYPSGGLGVLLLILIVLILAEKL